MEVNEKADLIPEIREALQDVKSVKEATLCKAFLCLAAELSADPNEVEAAIRTLTKVHNAAVAHALDERSH